MRQPGHQLTRASVRYARSGSVQSLEGDPDGLRRAVVHRVAQPSPVGRSADPPLLGEHQLARRGDERAHPLEVALPAERLAALALLGQDPVEHELGRDAGVIEARQEERPVPAHPGVADHQVLDRGPLGVAEVERAGDVGGRLDDRERRQRRVRRRARSVRREDVRREPALVDRALDVVWRIGLRQLRHLALLNTERPARPADERVVVPPAGSTSGALPGHPEPPGPASSRRAIGRLPSRLASDLHDVVPARLAPSRTRFGVVPSLLFPVPAVRRRV